MAVLRVPGGIDYGNRIMRDDPVGRFHTIEKDTPFCAEPVTDHQLVSRVGSALDDLCPGFLLLGRTSQRKADNG